MVPIHQNYSLLRHNTFRLNVQTQLFARVETETQLKDLFLGIKYRNTRKMILGGGSNVLFTHNWLGLIVHMGIPGISIESETDEHVLVKSGAGVPWHQLVLWAVEHGFGGIENLSLIPGTVGAAPMQNIGAYGVELKETFHSLEALELKTGKIARFYKEDCSFGYRHSVFKGELKNQYIITQVYFSLNKQPQVNTTYGAIEQTLSELGISKPTIKDVSRAVIQIRQSKLPDPEEIGNAGSFFKNPVIEKAHFEALQALHPDIPNFPAPKKNEVKIPAAWLIEQCGWKGYRDGDIGVHEKQALVLVNYGNGKGTDIRKLSLEIMRTVHQKFQVELQAEVNIV
jgi:UDP-N-acetylmuramate dehydrogenase